MASGKEKKGLKGYFLTTFLIGLGFFTMGLMDPLYDTYVPIFLSRFIESTTIIGIIMALDNVLAVFLIPFFSALSDRTNTRMGRRMPYIVSFLPLAAIFFAMIPFSAMESFWFLIASIFFLNIFKQAVRGPVVALMPDIVPADLRSEANGVINTMGGIATILGTVLLARLMDVKIRLPFMKEPSNNILAFPVAAIFVVIAVILLFIFVNEKKQSLKNKEVDEREDKEKKEPLFKSLKAIVTEKEKSALFILLSLFMWFMSYQGILPFVGVYSQEVLRTSSGNAALAAGMVGIAYAIFAVPSGKVAHRIGRKKTIRIALMCIIAILVLITIHGFILTSIYGVDPIPEDTPLDADNPLLENYGTLEKEVELASSKGNVKPPFIWTIVFWILLFLFGIFWVTVVTNSFPMLWQMADYQTMGIYTGVYYFFSQLAAIIAPILAGAVIDIGGYPALFIYGVIFMLVAFILMKFVHRGEPEHLIGEKSNE